MKLVEEVLKELDEARLNFPPFRSMHEGYAIIKEELDELWIEIKSKNPKFARKEAIQLSAMAIRFLVDFEEMAKE